jgi:hypothetical protein
VLAHTRAAGKGLCFMGRETAAAAPGGGSHKTHPSVISLSRVSLLVLYVWGSGTEDGKLGQ